jgi:RHS repeat-associated protein
VNNRYYSNAYGRFMTPDPYKGISGGSGDPGDPQSWNRYAYTLGDPVNRGDPMGMDSCAAANCVTVTGTYDSLDYQSFSYGNGYYSSSWIAGLVQQGVSAAQGAAGQYKTGGWDKEVSTLSNGNQLIFELLLSGTLPMTPECQKDLDALSAATGIGIFQIPYTINNQSWVDGTSSTATVCSSETQADSVAYNFYCGLHPTFTFAQLFANNTSIGAWTALPGSASAGSVFFNPNALQNSPFSSGFAAGLLIHEAFHTLGALDGTLLTALGYSADDTSDKVNSKLSKDCFNGQ